MVAILPMKGKGHLQQQILANIKEALNNNDVTAIKGCLKDMMERTLVQLKESFEVDADIQNGTKLLHLFVNNAPLKLTEALLNLGAKADYQSLELSLDNGPEALQLLINRIDNRPVQCAYLFDKLFGSKPSEMSDPICEMLPMIVQHMRWSYGGSRTGMGFKEVLQRHVGSSDSKNIEGVTGTVFGTKKQWPLIFIVARSGNSELMKNWLECKDLDMGLAAKKQLSAVTPTLANCLHGACWCGHNEMAATLIPYMSDELKTASNSYGETPLMNAARLSLSSEVLEMLLPSYAGHEARLKTMAMQVAARKGGEVDSGSPDVSKTKDRQFDRDTANDGFECEIHQFLPSDYKPPPQSLVAWFMNEEHLKTEHFKFEGDRPRRNFIGEVKRRVGYLVSKPGKFSIQERAALIGVPDASEALDMFIAVWCYTSETFYNGSMLKYSMSALATKANLPKEEIKAIEARIEFLKPYIYFLQKALERFPSSIRKNVFFRGDNRFSANNFKIGQILPFNIFTSSSMDPEIVLKDFVGPEDMRSCCFIVLGSGCNIERMSFFPQESEELFRPDVRYQVLWIINPSMLRIFGCHFDIVMLSSLERSNVHEERSRKLHLICEAWCKISSLISKRLIRYVQPRLYKDSDSTGLENPLNSFVEELSKKKEPPRVMIHADITPSNPLIIGKKVSEALAGIEGKNYRPLIVPMSGLKGDIKTKGAIDNYITTHLIAPQTPEELFSGCSPVVVLVEDIAIPYDCDRNGELNLLTLNPAVFGRSWVFVTAEKEDLTLRGLTPKELLGTEVVLRYPETPFNDFFEELISEGKLPPVMIQAEAGGGKSTAGVKVAGLLAGRKYSKDKDYFPLFVPMSSMGNAFEPNAIDDYIIQHVLPEDCCILELISLFQMVIILDSFDEGTADTIGSSCTTNLMELNPNLLGKSWVMVTSRTEHLIRHRLTPEDLLGNEVESRYLHPFNGEERDKFGSNMIKESKRVDETAKAKEPHVEKLATEAIARLKSQGIWNKLTSPLLLYMAVNAAMHTEKMEASSLSDIYEVYIKSSLHQQVKADRTIAEGHKSQISKEARLAADLLACRMLETGRWEGTLATYSQKEGDMDMIKKYAKYLPVYYDAGIKDDTIRFHHKTLAEYLIARRVSDCKNDEFEKLMSMPQFAKNHPGIIDIHKYIQQSNNAYDQRQNRFLKLIRLAINAKSDNIDITKASNAFSFLVSSGCTLYGEDLSGISLRHASLCGGCLVKVKFEGSTFDHCDFNRCQLTNCNFSGASVINATVDVMLPPIVGPDRARSMFTPSSLHTITVFGNRIELHLTATGQQCGNPLDELHELNISALACGHCSDPDHQKDLIIATCSDGSDDVEAVIHLWKPFLKKSSWGSITLPPGNISFSDLSLSVDDAHIAAGVSYGGQSLLVVWEVAEREQEFDYDDEEEMFWLDDVPGETRTVQYMHNGKLVYTKGNTIHIKYLSDDKTEYIGYQQINEPGATPMVIAIPPVQTNCCAVQYFVPSTVSGSYDSVPDRVDIYDEAMSKVVQTIKISTDGGIALSGCGQYLACGGKQIVDIYDLATKKIVKTLSGHNCPVMSIWYSANGDYITTAGISTDDKTVRLWSTKGEGRMLEEGHKKPVTHLSICGNKIASVCQDNVIIIWNCESGAHHRRLPPLSGSLIALAFCEQRLFTVVKDEKKEENILTIWSTTTWEPVQEKTTKGKMTIICMDASLDTMYVGSDKGLHAYDTDLNEKITPATKHITKGVKHVACQNDSVACVCENEVLLLKGNSCQKFDAPEGRRCEYNSVTLSPCCKFIIATDDKEIFKWNTSTKAVTALRQEDKAINPTFCNGTFACGVKDGIIVMSEGETKLIGQNKPINAIAMSNEGSVIVSASDNLRVWRRKDSRWELQYYLGEKRSFSVKGGTTPNLAERMFAAAREL
eukprot:TRINITY_DN540_c0_g2_i1.p1 TRINITY_DN540_c0_g2~~TRINITY_DN540_c0_g2_i1.p1  ORF type:complete len:1921 (+),score=308.98 TRINITY_DN540_c0_g2_i1:70-5832(+)